MIKRKQKSILIRLQEKLTKESLKKKIRLPRKSLLSKELLRKSLQRKSVLKKSPVPVLSLRLLKKQQATDS